MVDRRDTDRRPLFEAVDPQRNARTPERGAGAACDEQQWAFAPLPSWWELFRLTTFAPSFLGNPIAQHNPALYICATSWTSTGAARRYAAALRFDSIMS